MRLLSGFGVAFVEQDSEPQEEQAKEDGEAADGQEARYVLYFSVAIDDIDGGTSDSLLAQYVGERVQKAAVQIQACGFGL